MGGLQDLQALFQALVVALAFLAWQCVWLCRVGILSYFILH